MSNKYEQIPDHTVDFHGFTTREASSILDSLIKSEKYRHVRVITGKGDGRQTGPVMRQFVKDYLFSKGIRFNISKRENGGDGVLEVFLK